MLSRSSGLVSTVLLVAALASVASCHSSAPPPEPPASPAASHGLDLTALDRSVDPGDDFYAFANGAWLKRTEIPGDRSTWGPSEAMTEETAQRTRQLLEEAARVEPAAGTVRQQAADYYASYMDEAEIEG